jgi:lipopolysaccharide/colanic/teichoic acid biosynthesis glycosyltransferase
MSKGSGNSNFFDARLVNDLADLPLVRHAGSIASSAAARAGRADLHLLRLPGEGSRPRLRPLSVGTISLFAQHLEAGGEIVVPQGNLSRGYRGAKRLLDLIGGLGLLLLLSPIMIATWLVLLITTRGKPIFCQTRLGYCGRPFRMYKFRTMCLDAEGRQAEVANEQDGPVFKNRRDPRTTRIGRLLRVTSLDETPQFFNVLAGQMSLVGPRPPVAREVAQYQAWQRRRLAVKPGLTCLWQVSGRSEIGFEEWVRMDLRYVRTQSLATDLKLLARTPWSVLNRRGAY